MSACGAAGSPIATPTRAAFTSEDVQVDYLVAISPDLNLDPAGVIAAWNYDPAARALAQAQPANARAQSFDPTLGAVALSVAGSIALGVLSNFLTDWLRSQWRARHPDDRERVQVTQAPQEIGPPILVVTIVRD
jgi:hypothetical protein